MITDKDGQIIQFLDHMQDLVRLRIVKDYRTKVSLGIPKDQARKEADLAGGKRLRRIINKYDRRLSWN